MLNDPKPNFYMITLKEVGHLIIKFDGDDDKTGQGKMS